MTKLQELTAAIQKAVPEIMELKFGCKLMDNCSASDFFERTLILLDKPDRYNKISLLVPEFYSIFGSLKDYEILGRDITLEDVLTAIYKINPHSYLIDISGQFWVWENSFDTILTPEEHIPKKIDGVRWIPGKPLHEQSEETKNFLHSIICLK